VSTIKVEPLLNASQPAGNGNAASLMEAITLSGSRGATVSGG
jgi:hypothetical protein